MEVSVHTTTMHSLREMQSFTCVRRPSHDELMVHNTLLTQVVSVARVVVRRRRAEQATG